MQIVVVADIVMSLDNVIAVAAAANGSVPLLMLGLAISIPLIVAGAALIMALLNRLPILVWAGAALLGWIAGEVIATDPAVHPMLQRFFDGPVGVKLDATCWRCSAWRRASAAADMAVKFVCAVLGVIVVLVAGSIWRKRGCVVEQRRTRSPATRIPLRRLSPLEFDAERALVRLRGGAKLAVVVDIEPRGIAQAQRRRGTGVGAIPAFADALHRDALRPEADVTSLKFCATLSMNLP